MTEYVTPNIHTVLKKYQTSAPKSLQGPGHALTAAAGCPTGPNCPIDASTFTGASGSGGGNTDLNIAGVRNLCGGHLSLGSLPTNTSGNHKLSPHCPHIASSSPACSNSPNSGTGLPPATALIKKEVLSSPEPHELGEILPPQTLPLPLSMSSQVTQTPSQTASSQSSTTAVKIIPPPPPELSQPVFAAPDSGSGVLYETRLEGKTIGCFSLGGEMRLCLPQFLNNVLADFTLDQINRIFDELGIYCSQCTPDQLLEFKTAKILPPDVKASGLITRTDAERLCAALLNRVDRNSYISDEDIPRGAISFKVYHRCFGKCDGICTPDLYSYTKPTCIMCLECKGWFSPQKFVGHVHREVENRTCHWGFDSRNWHDYLHVALDVENREKYQKILDELKEVEIKEALKAQNEMIYMKRKHALHVDEEMLGPPQLGHSLPGMALPPHHQAHQTSGLSEKQRSDMLALPAKKAKGFDEAAAYQLDYQHYQSLMYAHCAQQQRVGSMSAFRPWAPKSFLHPSATYNAVAAFSTLPYLSQEPPVLQNPERVVRSTDRERFERTYQPNVALVPRKCVLAKEREKEQREKDRERIEREREVERMREREREREQERKLEHSREREKQELDEQERERKEREIQEHRRQQMLQQQNLHQKQQSPVETLPEQMTLTNLCPTEVKIKQERANTPTEISQSPPLTNMSGDDDNSPHNHNGLAIPMVSPIAIAMSQQHRKMLSNNNGSSNSSSCHSEGLALQQQQLQEQQSRRHSLYNTNSFACSTSSTTSTTPPQQPLLHVHLPPPKQYQQELRQGHQLSQQQQPSHLRQSPHPYPPSPTETHSSEEFSGSNEITSSTSPAPCIKVKTTNRDNGPRATHTHTQESSRVQQCQPLIATVNQHAKLLPTPITPSFTANSNSNNHNELPSRIRISKNLINRSNIIRSPTPPPSLPPSLALIQLHPHQEQHHPQQQQQQQPQPQQHQPQLQTLQNHHQQYEFHKQNQRLYDQQFEQQQQQQQHKHLVIRSHHHSQVKHSPSQSSTVTGLNLSTHATKDMMQLQPRNCQKQQEGQQPRQYNGIPYIGSEFELSTDTDDDSVNGEADSSHITSAWDGAIEALRDTRPKERERVLDLLRKVLHENQQMRYSNLQLSEMVQKRDVVIRELREQLQTCRRHLQVLSLRQELPDQTNVSDGLRDEEARGLQLKGSLSNMECVDIENNGVAEDVGGDDGNDYNSTTPLGSPTEKAKQSANDQLSDSEDGRGLSCNSKESEYDSDNGSDKESEHADDSINVNNDLRNSDHLQLENSNDVKDIDTSEPPQAKRSRLASDSDSNCSLNEEYSTVKHTTNRSGEQASHITKQNDENSYDSEENEAAPTTNTISEFAEYTNINNNGYPKISNTDNHVDDEEEEEATRFSTANGSESNTNASEDEGNDSGQPLTHPLVTETDVQAPHTSSLSTIPTATTPLSPHSAATAGQLFDSSNSSDESSMKKAQMSASNALAKITEITETADDVDDGNDEAGEDKELWRTKENTQLNAAEKQKRDRAGVKPETSVVATSNAKTSRFIINKEPYSSRSGRYPTKSNSLSAKTHDIEQTSGFNENKFDVNVKVNNSDDLCKEALIPRTPLPTKASKKQTPTPNTELRIKKEII